MNGATWVHDPWSNKMHHPDCVIWDTPPSKAKPCTCAELTDHMVEEFQRVKPYTRPVSVPQTDPNAPYQSLATMIRTARTQGILKPIQQYGGGTAPTP